MRHVYPSHEIPNLWAHKTQQSARNQQGNFFFDGDTIYSYGSHFPIARHVTNKRKQEAVLFTMRTRSLTTARHISDVRQAIRHLTVLHIPDAGNFTELSILSDFTRLIITGQRDCFGPTGRFRPKAWGHLATLIPTANAYAQFVGSRRRWTMPETSDAIRDSVARAKAAEDRARNASVRKAAKARAARLVKLTADLEQWRAGGGRWPASYSHYYSDLPTALRVVGDVVETSLGANVPIDHARLGLRFVRKCRDTHTPYQRNGHTLHLGHYAIDAIDELGNLTAGCHRIAIEEIERIAPLLEA